MMIHDGEVSECETYAVIVTAGGGSRFARGMENGEGGVG